MEPSGLSPIEELFQFKGKVDVSRFDLLDLDDKPLTGIVYVEGERLYTKELETAFAFNMKYKMPLTNIQSMIDKEGNYTLFGPNGERHGFWLAKKL